MTTLYYAPVMRCDDRFRSARSLGLLDHCAAGIATHGRIWPRLCCLAIARPGWRFKMKPVLLEVWNLAISVRQRVSIAAQQYLEFGRKRSRFRCSFSES
jgi:hypothetical protein